MFVGRLYCALFVVGCRGLTFGLLVVGCCSLLYVVVRLCLCVCRCCCCLMFVVVCLCFCRFCCCDSWLACVVVSRCVFFEIRAGALSLDVSRCLLCDVY